MFILGLGHYSRTGKDTLANYTARILHDRGFRVLKRPLAWKLKQITYELYAWAGMKSPEHYETLEGAKDRDIVLPDLGMTPVEVWVAFGTKAVRDNVYDRTWLDYLLNTDHNADVLIIPDVRFKNEADAILYAGGTLIKVIRPGYEPRDTVADKALLNYEHWDRVVGHSGRLEELLFWANKLADFYESGFPLPYTYHYK